MGMIRSCRIWERQQIDKIIFDSLVIIDPFPKKIESEILPEKIEHIVIPTVYNRGIASKASITAPWRASFSGRTTRAKAEIFFLTIR